MEMTALNIGFWLIIASYEILTVGILSDAFFGNLYQFGRIDHLFEIVSNILAFLKNPVFVMGKAVTGRAISRLNKIT